MTNPPAATAAATRSSDAPLILAPHAHRRAAQTCHHIGHPPPSGADRRQAAERPDNSDTPAARASARHRFGHIDYCAYSRESFLCPPGLGYYLYLPSFASKLHVSVRVRLDTNRDA